MRTRAISAVVLVPVVVDSVPAGQPWLTLGIASWPGWPVAKPRAGSPRRPAGRPRHPDPAAGRGGAGHVAPTAAAPQRWRFAAAGDRHRGRGRVPEARIFATRFLAWAGGVVRGPLGVPARVRAAPDVDRATAARRRRSPTADLDSGRTWLLRPGSHGLGARHVRLPHRPHLPRGRMFPTSRPTRPGAAASAGPSRRSSWRRCSCYRPVRRDPDVRARSSAWSSPSSAQAGDAAESMVKRAAGAKDSGNAHPWPRRRARPDRLVPLRGAGPGADAHARFRARDPNGDGCRRTGPIRVALLGSTGLHRAPDARRLRRQPATFQVVALAAGGTRDVQAQLAAQPRVAHCGAAGRPPSTPLAELDGDRCARPDSPRATTSTCSSSPRAGVVSLRPILAALHARQARGDGQQGDARRRRPPGDAARPRAGGDGARRRRPLRSSPLFWLRPIDSEHSAIWQCLAGERLDSVRRVILTASGGPFRDWPAERLASAHPGAGAGAPELAMGAKITIDSASLMNKGLEVIEARWLYDLAYEQIDVLVHPQSLVHSARRVRRWLPQGPTRTP